MDALFKFPNLCKDVVGTIKIEKIIEANDLERKSGGHSQQIGLSLNMSCDKERKKFRPSNQHKGQTKGTTPNKDGNQVIKPSNVENK